MKKIKNSGEYNKKKNRIKDIQNEISNGHSHLSKIEEELKILYKQTERYEKETMINVEYLSDKDLVDQFSKEQLSEAMKIALDTRNFEIDMYWKRATYFWAFIATIFAGYFLLVAYGNDNWFLLSLIAFLGNCFSFGWFLVNRGSKYWQENWEGHIGALSKRTTGEIFKHWLRPNYHFKELSGNYPISVSKTNQFLSIVTFVVWFIIYIISILDCPALYDVKYEIIKYLNCITSFLKESATYQIILLLIFVIILMLVLRKMLKFSKNKSAYAMGEHLKSKHKSDEFIKFKNMET
ncbi:hypothetical protein [Bacteroides sp. 519]|uniref:RipA family octameric membrane protein n=1 Tax=Bacteroides sp. 519 TaxID=2302937 RepID=UPI0013D198AB|nr:hypothetical protein [Bacteroides sp. 519]